MNEILHGLKSVVSRLSENYIRVQFIRKLKIYGFLESFNKLFLPLFIILIVSSLAGLSYLRLYQGFKFFTKSQNDFKVDLAQASDLSESVQGSILPELISIPSLELNLNVSPGVISGNNWTLFEDKVSWLSTSAAPGSGNVILYAHNRPHLFGNLDRLEIGDEIKLKAGEKTFSYFVTEKRKVLPKDVESVVSSENRLTLYTCDGTFDEKRLVVVAAP